MALCAPARPALVALAMCLAVPILTAAAPTTRRAASSDQRWTAEIQPDGSFAFGPTEQPGRVTGQLPQAPDEVVVLRSGRGLVAIDARSGPGLQDALVLVDGTGQVWARHDLDALFGAAAVESFWAPDGASLAWRVEQWVDEEAGAVVLIPDRPAQPVAVSLEDGLVENTDPELYVRRMASSGLWFGKRLRALELAAASSPEPEGLIPELRAIVRERDAPLLLRLRAAAILQQHGDGVGRGLVLLTARSRSDRDALAALRPEELRRLPEAWHPCDRIPEAAAQRPYDHRAARSYAIQLLPTFLGAEAGPQLGELLAGEDEQDRFDALQAIACLAAREPGTTDGLLARVRQRHERETRRLGGISRIVPLGDEAVPSVLQSDALSLDVGRSGDAVEALLERSPASNPVLAGLLEEGSPDDVRIAEHFVRHPDPTMIDALLVAVARYRDVPETAAPIVGALWSCLPDAERTGAPGALEGPEAWLEWGRRWRTKRRLQLAGQLLIGLLPLAVLVGVTRRREAVSDR